MHRLETTDALVVRRVEYRDADLILTLFTRGLGKLSALARSARSSRRRFGGGLGLATLSRVELRPGRGSELWTLLSARPLQTFSRIGADVVALAHASYGIELVRELTATEVADESLFDLLLELLGVLDSPGPSPHALRAFELRLLDAIGLGPMIVSCAACNQDDDARFARGAVLDPDRGGIVCGHCAGASRGLGVRAISGEARAVLVAAKFAASLAEGRRGRADGRRN